MTPSASKRSEFTRDRGLCFHSLPAHLCLSLSCPDAYLFRGCVFLNCIREFHAYRLRESRDHVAVLTIQAVVGPAEDPDVDSACLSYRRHRRNLVRLGRSA